MTQQQPSHRAPAAPISARPLGPGTRGAAIELLERDPRANLFLLDLLTRMGAPPAPGEARSELFGAFRGGELLAVLALRPSIAVTDAPAEVLEAFVPYLETVGVGLMKSCVTAVDLLWDVFGRRRGRRVVLDRRETAYAVREPRARLVDPRPHEIVRPAGPRDLESLIVAARESLREEDRPDPYRSDVRGFKRWVRGRVERARVVESHGRIVCVGYADVRLPAGWLLQGVYCWPDARRRGHATTGVSDLCRQAFTSGADHVQLAVVEGNVAGRRLYQRLGFEPFGSLRTILFD